MRNPEGYVDPTAFIAVNKTDREVRESVKRYRPMVYICSPYSDDPEGNTAKAREYARACVDKGYLPVAPHLMFPQFMDETERETIIHMDIALLSKCKEVWVCGGRETAGMKEEIRKAKKYGKIIRCFDGDMNEVSGI